MSSEMRQRVPAVEQVEELRDHWLNMQIAERPGEAADLLERQGANPFRVAACRCAAETVLKLKEAVLTTPRALI